MTPEALSEIVQTGWVDGGEEEREREKEGGVGGNTSKLLPTFLSPSAAAATTDLAYSSIAAGVFAE